MTSQAARVAPQPRERRRYDSTLRQQIALQNRKAVLDAATVRFCERGWAASVRDIARAAGVSVETVYTHFGSKVGLLNQVVDVAVVGDDDPVALVDRPEFTALSTGSRRERARAAAALNTAINQRTTPLFRALREAAAVEPVLASRLQGLRESQRQTVHAALAMVVAREVSATQADGLWALLSQEVYELLVGSADWTPAQYEAWLAQAITTLLDIHD
jgi:AcrR family transcriptional regulator